MAANLSPSTLSLILTACGFLIALFSSYLGQQINYLQFLLMFNLMAITILILVSMALVVALLALIKRRGRSYSLWFAASLATLVLGSYLWDE